MTEWIQLGVFAGKVLIFLLAFIGILIAVSSIALRFRQAKENLEIEDLNEKFKNFSQSLKQILLPEKTLKAEQKAEKKKNKEQEDETKPTVFVLDFPGDIRASHVDNLRDEITAILSVAQADKDEVVITLESSGGMVHAYGLAASQLLRIREKKIKLTICVDKIAASGGYMMACTANQILAAPFAIIGSIGVIAQVPNLHRLLKKHEIDYEEITAGEFKRTVSLFGEITDRGRQKFLEQIEETHGLFKDFVKTQRPQIDIKQVATGEYWYGEKAKSMGLVDQLMSSDAYLYSHAEDKRVLKVQIAIKKPLNERLSEILGQSLEKVFFRWWQKGHDNQFGGL